MKCAVIESGTFLERKNLDGQMLKKKNSHKKEIIGGARTNLSVRSNFIGVKFGS